MKKLIYAAIIGATVLTSSTILYANDNIKVYVDGAQVSYSVQPVVQNGTTLVPLRKTFEVLGANVDWNNQTQTVTSTKGDTTVKLTIGSNTAYKNGNSFNIPVAPTIINGSTYVPLRFVSESFDADVSWDGTTKSININNNSATSNAKTVYTDYVPYSTGDLETLARNVLNGNVVKINGQYYATPEYANLINNTTVIDLSDTPYTGPTVYANMSDEDIKLAAQIAARDSLNNIEPKYDVNKVIVTTLHGDPVSSSTDIDGIVESIAPTAEDKINKFNARNLTWVSSKDLEDYLGISFTWLGEEIAFFDARGEKIFTLTGSPKGKFEKDVEYSNDGLRYKYTDKIVFNVDDLKATGIIK